MVSTCHNRVLVATHLLLPLQRGELERNSCRSHVATHLLLPLQRGELEGNRVDLMRIGTNDTIINAIVEVVGRFMLKDICHLNHNPLSVVAVFVE
jgi:hypothetical protein